MLEWIRETVNTAGRPCPVIKMRKCPGKREGCARWVTMQIGDGNQQVLVEGCSDLWMLVVSQMAVNEQVRVQAGLDKTATELQKTKTQLANSGAAFDHVASGAGVLMKLAQLTKGRSQAALEQ